MFAFNFVNNKYQDQLPTLLEKTWLEICIEHSGKSVNKQCHIRSPFVFDKLKSVFDINWNLDRDIFLSWIDNLIESASDRCELLSDATYFETDYHPNILGHQLWAEYVYKELTREQ